MRSVPDLGVGVHQGSRQVVPVRCQAPLVRRVSISRVGGWLVVADRVVDEDARGPASPVTVLKNLLLSENPASLSLSERVGQVSRQCRVGEDLSLLIRLVGLHPAKVAPVWPVCICSTGAVTGLGVAQRLLAGPAYPRICPWARLGLSHD